MPVVVIPVLNEARALPALLAAMPAGYRPLVVDNGSTDGSADVARRHGAQVVSEPIRGFGSACWAGLLAADPTDGVVCFMDGDGSFDPAQLVGVAGPVLANGADLVLGARRSVGRRSWPVHARVANQVLAGLLNRTPPLRRSGTTLRDLGPMRAARRDDLLALGLRDRRSGWPLEMVLAASEAGWRIREVEVAYHPRVGRSKVTGTLRGTLTAVGDMGRLLARRRLSDIMGKSGITGESG
ncbi:MAG: glycosyltransferase family 2 protein [Actinomycetota bacterium]|nr:glycosyltransferase family 2 protein [Actinomycetota bacterium]